MCSLMSDDERSGDYPYRNRAIGSVVGGGDREHRSAGEQRAAAKVWLRCDRCGRFENPTFSLPEPAAGSFPARGAPTRLASAALAAIAA
jgi:hypothetical protein